MVTPHWVSEIVTENKVNILDHNYFSHSTAEVGLARCGNQGLGTTDRLLTTTPSEREGRPGRAGVA